MKHVYMTLHLAVSSSMSSVAQGIKRISAVGGIEIRASWNTVLSRIGRSAVTLRQWVMLEVVVSAWDSEHTMHKLIKFKIWQSTCTWKELSMLGNNNIRGHILKILWGSQWRFCHMHTHTHTRTHASMHTHIHIHTDVSRTPQLMSCNWFVGPWPPFIIYDHLHSSYNQYSATSTIRTPLSTALILAYRISEIVRITEVPTFLAWFMIPNLETIPI